MCEPCVRLQYGTFLKPRGRVGLDAQIKQCVFARKCVSVWGSRAVQDSAGFQSQRSGLCHCD